MMRLYGRRFKIVTVNDYREIMVAFENTDVITEAITRAAKRAANYHKIANVPMVTEKDGEIIVVQAEQL